ncbi:HAD-IIIC family phosphatase [Actinosynnema sp. NPDC020468]|uniref:HAD-IIIC family phosphatase n=1 Tax=Actinosynnema sp. NPDC020468 TaxID=3154488 RepID=UPI00340D770F
MQAHELLARVRAAALPDAEPDLALPGDLVAAGEIPVLLEAGRLLERVPGPAVGATRALKVAITGTFTAAGVAPLLRIALLRHGIAAEIRVSGFDRLVADLADPDALAAFAPDVVLCLLHDGWLVPEGWDPTDLDALGGHLHARVALLEGALAGYGGTVLVHTVPLSPAEHRGVVAFDARAALGRLWREVNSELLALAERYPHVHALDLEALLVGEPVPVRDERLYRFATSAWTPAVELLYARQAANFGRAVLGKAKKVLVLDLDNTLWGGVVGDDGPEGVKVGGGYPGNCFSELQRRAVALRRQGVLLALCSKNDPDLVDRVLATHPDLDLRDEDLAAKAVNWEPKDLNLRRLAEQLNLGLDAFVFADDSAFEVGLVRGSLPGVSTVHLDGDPAEHVRKVLADGHFDVLTTTATDRERTALYRARAQRERAVSAFATPEEYLRSLDIRVAVREVDEFALPRLVQLGGRTNQFTMTGTPHTEARTRAMADSPDHLALVFEVSDRFGREGIVGGVWVAKGDRAWVVENFVMSCRVFSRGVEHTVLQHVADLAADAGAVVLAADFRATGRNGPAAAFYPAVGFTAVGDRHELPLVPRPRISPQWTVLDVGGAPVDV